MTSSINFDVLPQDIVAYQILPRAIPTPIWLINKDWSKAFFLFIQMKGPKLFHSLTSRHHSNLFQFLNLRVLSRELNLQQFFPGLKKAIQTFGVQCPDVLSIEDIDVSSQQIENEALKKVWTRIANQIQQAQPGIKMPSMDSVEEIRHWMSDENNEEYLEGIIELNLMCSDLTVLPIEIKYLTKLRRLHLEFNQLVNLPVEIGQLKALVFLNLQNNQLTHLPAEIGQLTNLQALDLSHNELNILSAEIGQLADLEVLKLSHNQLTDLPLEFEELINLNFLDLSYNKLTDISDEILQLPNLYDLNLSYNPLSNISAKTYPPSLNILMLENNPLSALHGNSN